MESYEGLQSCIFFSQLYKFTVQLMLLFSHLHKQLKLLLLANLMQTPLLLL